MSFSFKLSGFDLLDKELSKLPEAAERKIGVKALRKAGQPILKSMRSKAPVLTGEGRRSLFMKALKPKSKKIKVIIGPRVGKRANNDGFHLKFIEFGTENIPAKPFARPAYDEHKHNVPKIVGEELWKGILKEIIK